MKIRPLLIVTAASLTSCGVGVVVGYKIAERELTLRFEERLQKEIEASTAYYEHVNSTTKKFSTPEEAAAALIKPGTVLAEKPSMPIPTVGPAERVAYHKIVGNYVSEDEPEDPDNAVAREIMFPKVPDQMPAMNVHTSVPHVIEQDVFMDNVSEWPQSTLMWYTVDKVLTDETDKVIEDVDETVGLVNLERFGEGSSDPNIVHVRNPRLNLEFEIVQHDGSYRKQVLGMDDDPPKRPSGRG